MKMSRFGFLIVLAAGATFTVSAAAQPSDVGEYEDLRETAYEAHDTAGSVPGPQPSAVHEAAENYVAAISWIDRYLAENPFTPEGDADVVVWYWERIALANSLAGVLLVGRHCRDAHYWALRAQRWLRETESQLGPAWTEFQTEENRRQLAQFINNRIAEADACTIDGLYIERPTERDGPEGWHWASWAGGGALFVTGAILGISGSALESNLDATEEGLDSNQFIPDASDIRDRAAKRSSWGTALMVGGAAVAIVAAIHYWATHDDGEPTSGQPGQGGEDDPDQPPTVSFAPSWSDGGPAAVFSITF